MRAVLDSILLSLVCYKINLIFGVPMKKGSTIQIKLFTLNLLTVLIEETFFERIVCMYYYVSRCSISLHFCYISMDSNTYILFFQNLSPNMSTPAKVLVVLSSVRDGRHGAKVGQAVMKHLESNPSISAEILGK